MGHCQCFDTLNAFKKYLCGWLSLHDGPHRSDYIATPPWSGSSWALDSCDPQRSCADRSVLRSSSSKSSAWVASSHRTFAASLRLRSVACFRPCSTWTSFRCEIFMEALEERSRTLTVALLVIAVLVVWRT